MDKLFKTLGFWTAMFAILFYVGDMMMMTLFFIAQTGFFILLGYMKLTERMYMYVFAAYLVFFFCRIYILHNLPARAEFR